MKIHAIEITNYKAFLGTYELKIGGKNLFIYGENAAHRALNTKFSFWMTSLSVLT